MDKYRPRSEPRGYGNLEEEELHRMRHPVVRVTRVKEEKEVQPMKNPQVVTRSLVLACAIALAACADYPKDKATAIVTAPYPGKNQIDQCKPYADALYKALKVQKIKAWEVSFLAQYPTNTNLHAMVVYQDAGSYWYVDNEFPFPTKSWGKTPLEWAQDRSNVTTSITVVNGEFTPPTGYCQVLHVSPTDGSKRQIARNPLHRHNKTRRMYAAD